MAARLTAARGLLAASPLLARPRDVLILPRTAGWLQTQGARCAHRLPARSRKLVPNAAPPASSAEPAATSEGWWTKGTTSNMKDVNSIQELVDELVRLVGA
jgi:hypothetical protein